MEEAVTLGKIEGSHRSHFFFSLDQSLKNDNNKKKKKKKKMVIVEKRGKKESKTPR